MESLIGKRLIEIRGKKFETNNKSFEEIYFVFPEANFVISVNEDTDELIPSINRSLSLTQYEKLDLLKYEGEILKSIWQCKNHMNYNDLIVIGIGGFQPSLSLCCAASQIFISEILESNIN